MSAAHHPKAPVLRFAPSPNGLLHLGHALSALENEALAARLGGRLLLRIEDIDTTRCRPEFEAAMIDDLAWLGVAFEMPPRVFSTASIAFSTPSFSRSPSASAAFETNVTDELVLALP